MVPLSFMVSLQRGTDHTQSVLGPALGALPAMLASTLGATIIALPFYVFKSLLVGVKLFRLFDQSS